MEQLTAEEQDFIVQTLQNVQLSGSPDSLRQALSLIDSITEKLKPLDRPNLSPG